MNSIWFQARELTMDFTEMVGDIITTLDSTNTIGIKHETSVVVCGEVMVVSQELTTLGKTIGCITKWVGEMLGSVETTSDVKAAGCGLMAAQ